MELDKLLENEFFEFFPKQREAIQKALERVTFLVNLEQGSGKSLIAFYIIKVWFGLNLIKKVLFITKREVLDKFRNGLLQHIPSLDEKDIILMDDEGDRKFLEKEGKIYLCDYNQFKLSYYSYEGKQTDKARKYFKNVFNIDNSWGVIYDEVQVLKNTKSDVHKIVFKNTCNALARIATTGTPVEKIEELYAIFKIINEKIIGMTEFTFLNTIAHLMPGSLRIMYYKERGVKVIREKIDPFMINVKKSEITTVVDKVFSDMTCEFDTPFRYMYDREVEAIRYKILEDGFVVERQIGSLIQPVYNIVKKVDVNNPRFRLFDSMITRFTSNEKVLVWERSPQIIHDLHAYYQNKGIGSIYIDGTVDKMERESIIKRFNEDPSIKIFIVSFLATAESWEIPSRKDCRRMIFYSLPDRIINYSQATDRLHRISSEEDVYVYRLILKDSLDEWAAALLDYKQKIKDGMMDRLDFKKIEMASFIKHMGLDKKQIIVR